MRLFEVCKCGSLSLLGFVVVATIPCHASLIQLRAGAAIRSYTNTTSANTLASTSSETVKLEEGLSSTISSSSTSSSTSVTTPIAVLSSQGVDTNATSTITAAPTYAWGNQTIVNNTCSSMSDGALIWTPCHVFAGTVQLSYFPQNKGNKTYPTTYYNAALDFTMTSPSIYLVVNTITGDNSCGPLGPTYATQVIPMDLTDVYTLQPFANSTATSREGLPQILSLSDLETDCASASTHISTSGGIVNTHPDDNTYNRCNPRLVFPVELKRLGYPYWKHCGNNYYNFGIFDPPGAVPAVDSLFSTTVAVPVVSTTEPASPAPTAASEIASSTSSVLVSQPTTTSSVAIQDASTSTTLPSQSSISSSVSTGGDIVATDSGTSSTLSTQSSGLKSSGLPGEVLATVTTSNPTPTTIVGTSSFISNPAVVAPAPTSQIIATIAGQTISAAPGASTVVINGQVVSSGGSAVTLKGTDSVATLGSDGLVVQEAGGAVSTYSIPASTTGIVAAEGVAGATQVVGTIGSYTILATAGASVAVIGTQTLTAGGSVVTLGNNNVVSLGVSAVVVQSPGGGVSTVVLSASSVVATASGSNKVASAIASIIGASSSSKPSGVSTTTLPTYVLESEGRRGPSSMNQGWLLCTIFVAILLAIKM